MAELDYYAKAVIDLLREVRVGRLGGFDGCTCCHFKVLDVDIDVACGKGRNRGIWVFSHSMDFYDSEYKPREDMLRPIAEEVAKQVQEADSRGPVPIYCREWNKELDR